MSSNPGKLLKLTQIPIAQPLHTSFVLQKFGHTSVPLVAASVGIAEIGDEAKVATATRINAEEKRIICDLCVMGSDDSEGRFRKMVGFYMLNVI
jgi:hypothetical protein